MISKNLQNAIDASYKHLGTAIVFLNQKLDLLNQSFDATAAGDDELEEISSESSRELGVKRIFGRMEKSRKSPGWNYKSPG